jgi:hypothetical protein
MATPELVVSAVLKHLNTGQIEDATTCFAQQFTFKDHAIGLEVSDKQRLTQFFEKARELYPVFLLQTRNIFVSGEHVIAEWILQYTITEPFYAGLTRKLSFSLPGASIARVEEGKVATWADYYDGLTSRRTALGAFFTEWVEY